MLSQSARIYSEESGDGGDDKGLGYVTFQVRPHLNSLWFPNVRVEHLRELAKETTDTIYAIDDNTAIKVVDNTVTIVSEGKWEKLN